jgi:hypothetical protein
MTGGGVVVEEIAREQFATEVHFPLTYDEYRHFPWRGLRH